MRIFNQFIIILSLILSVSLFYQDAAADDAKQGDMIKIITPGTVARLCSHPNCGQDQHLTRIPKGTTLEIEGIIDVKSGIMKVKWYEVTFKGKRGWISIFDTNQAQ